VECRTAIARAGGAAAGVVASLMILFQSTRPVRAAPAARRHIGIYAYRRGYLRRFAAYGACQLERRERLEQLRALWHGDRIACAEAVEIPPAGVDTAADAKRLRGVDWPD